MVEDRLFTRLTSQDDKFGFDFSVLLSSFHLNSHTIGFQPWIKKLETRFARLTELLKLNLNSWSIILQIRWRPVLWGMSLQFVFALIILRTSHGFSAFKFIGDKVTRFLDYTDVGSAFVFGEDFAVHYIAFKVKRKQLKSIVKFTFEQEQCVNYSRPLRLHTEA